MCINEQVMKRIAVDKAKCSGCRLCEIVCSDAHYEYYDPRMARLRVPITYPLPSAPNVCRQCPKPRCVEACQTKALKIGSEIIEFDEALCDGCGSCVPACPFKAIWVSKKGAALKCDLCEGRSECVTCCPQYALSVVG